MEWPAILFALFFTTGSIFLRAAGYHTGAPADLACETMTPGHGVPPQTGQSPYRVIMPKKEWKSGEPIEITITSPTEGPSFKGFFIQIRPKGGNTPVGQFKPDSDPSNAQAVACGGAQNTGMTHKDSNLKTQVKLVWTPPEGNGEYVPVLTIVKQLDTFWVKETPAAPFKVSGSAAAEGSKGGESGPATSGNDTGSNSSQGPTQGGGASHIVPFWSAIIFVPLLTVFAFKIRV